MGNSISSQNYWVDDRDKLELDTDSKKLSYYILEIPKTKNPLFLPTKNGIIMFDNSKVVSDLFCSQSYFSGKAIIPTISTLRNYFPKTYSFIEKVYNQKLGFVMKGDVINFYYYSGVIYSSEETYNNTQPFEELDDCFFVYCRALKEEIRNVLNQDFIEQQENLKNKYNGIIIKISEETKESINKIKNKFEKGFI